MPTNLDGVPVPTLEEFNELKARVLKLEQQQDHPVPTPPPLSPKEGYAVVPAGGSPTHVVLGWQPSRVELEPQFYTASFTADGFFISSPGGFSGQVHWIAYH